MIQHGIQCQPVVSFLLRHIESHAVGAGIQIHLMQILMHIDIRHDAAAEGIVFQVIDHPIDLIHHPLFILMFHPHLIPVGLTDGAVFIRPFVPDMAVQIMHIVRLLLPDPQHLIRSALKRRPAQRHNRKLLRKVIPVHHPEFLDRISFRPVRPMRPDLLSLRTRSVLQNILTHPNKNMIRCAHLPSFPFPICPTYHRAN